MNDNEIHEINGNEMNENEMHGNEMHGNGIHELNKKWNHAKSSNFACFIRVSLN